MNGNTPKCLSGAEARHAYVMVQLSNQFNVLKLVYFFNTGFIFLKVVLNFSNTTVFAFLRIFLLHENILIIIIIVNNNNNN